jgi:imidazole glycerol-phosphate synthase subunit HisH
MNLIIIDYDAGNLRTVQKAIEHLGYRASISNDPQVIKKADALILPGVGSFADGMDNLKKLKLVEPIIEFVKVDRKPILGICLGMQLLAKNGIEGGDRNGLDLLPMEIKKFNFQNKELRIPHMGWNSVSLKKDTVLFKDVPDLVDFYFVHSYYCNSVDSTIDSAICNYGHDFVVAAEKDNIFSTQFHPEKSQLYGLRVLQNYLNHCLKVARS